MDWIEGLGYLAALLVFSSFYMKTMIPLRYAAIASNIIYIAYGYMASLNPMLILHALLLPLNISRLIQMRRLIQSVRKAAHTGLDMDWLIPYATPIHFRRNDLITRKGDIADKVYFITSGTVLIEGLGVSVGPGQLVGEIGVFVPDQRRTCTMSCLTDVETLAVTDDIIKQLYFQNPRVGFYLTQLIVGRLLEDQDLLFAKACLRSDGPEP